MNTNYAQYQALSERQDYVNYIMNNIEENQRKPEVKECIHEVVTDVATDQQSLQQIQDDIFKPVVVDPSVDYRKKEDGK